MGLVCDPKGKGGNEMIRKVMLAIMLCIVSALFMSGCGRDYGKVDQGRVIEFDRDRGTVTMIRDVKTDPGNPEYTYLPPLTYSLPKNVSDIGAEPKTGYRMKLDAANARIIIFDPVTKNFRTIEYKPVKQTENVEKNDPLVFDKSIGREKDFPVIDKISKTITVYSRRQKIVTTFSVQEEFLSMPPKTWEAGDDIRVNYREDGKALKMTNLSRTESYKK
ncbi:MAG TPA: DUF4881 domain-containing protein [Dissulfurispiraceae bacterium]|nr:DUF4881 domain-containing protein [Dissulfurispiraceae bacterium]